MKRPPPPTHQELLAEALISADMRKMPPGIGSSYSVRASHVDVLLESLRRLPRETRAWLSEQLMEVEIQETILQVMSSGLNE